MRLKLAERVLDLTAILAELFVRSCDKKAELKLKRLLHFRIITKGANIYAIANT